jgi:hypothetical protein
MKTLIRILLMLALIVWLGGEIFFPIVAAVAFGQLKGNTHQAGQIVAALLNILHGMGLVCGAAMLALLLLASAWGVLRPRAQLAPMAVVAMMMALTAYSQYGIIPAMERDRAQAPGGVIDALAGNDPARADFDRLHRRSTSVEGGVLLLGLGLVVLVVAAQARAARA